MQRAWLIPLLLVPRIALADEGAAVGRAVQELLRAHADEVRACVGGNDQAGEALLDVVAAKDRRVLAARVLKADAQVAEAARCVAKRAEGWRLAGFDVAEGDQIVVPLVFRPEPKPEARVVEVVKQLDLRDGLFALYAVEGKPIVEYKRPSPLGPGVGAVVGLPATLRCAPGERCRVLLVKLPADASFAGIYVFGFASLPVYPLRGDKGTVQLGTDGAPAVPIAMDWLELKAGVDLPTHAHEGSYELVYTIAGHGVMTRGKETLKVGPGQLLELAPGVPHGLHTDSPMTALQLYLPRGPEQRFKP